MKRKTFASIILYTVGGLVFALGMCMCLISEWNMFNIGIAAAVIGAIILGATLIYNFVSERKKIILPSKRAVGITSLGIAGVLVLGLGMCMTMVWQGLMIPGIVVGIVGIVLLLCLIPAIKGFKE